MKSQMKTFDYYHLASKAEASYDNKKLGYNVLLPFRMLFLVIVTFVLHYRNHVICFDILDKCNQLDNQLLQYKKLNMTMDDNS